jgi:acetyl-CoA decarbonylase/synthase complex subunit delta
MTVEIPKTTYTGQITEVILGKGGKETAVGGENCYPFYLFEGCMPNLPRIAMEVWDTTPADWAPAAVEPFQDVIDNPAAWARKYVADYGAELICLQMVSTDPNGLNRPAEEAINVLKSVAAAIDVPLIVWGTANPDKDTEILRLACEAVQDKKLVVGPVEADYYKKIAAAALGYGHTIAASSPIDINLAKQLNILIGNLGVPQNQLVMDPTVSSIGYGIEYCYSVMERIRIASLSQGDEKLQSPIICNISRETWKAKESKMPDDSLMGDAKKRGIMLEALSAQMLLLAGGDVVVMRHPEAVRIVRKMIENLS